jgi:hypothetical protein
MDVVVWLRSFGLGKYEAAFRENEIDETVSCEPDNADRISTFARELVELRPDAWARQLRAFVVCFGNLRERRTAWRGREMCQYSATPKTYCTVRAKSAH